MNTTETKVQPCQCLRTKNPYGTTPQNYETWDAGIATASTYWCLQTMAVAGPDEHYVHLARCVPGRSCYQAPEG
ncbi:MAG TPA: hypothetical protein VMU62_02290 [Acidobacteriaceae bacterium]|nr:hypothetical protein [Acidobacteriaceae bacterium]